MHSNQNCQCYIAFGIFPTLYVFLFKIDIYRISFASFALNVSYRIVDGKDGERYLMEVTNVLNVLKQLNI